QCPSAWRLRWIRERRSRLVPSVHVALLTCLVTFVATAACNRDPLPLQTVDLGPCPIAVGAANVADLGGAPPCGHAAYSDFAGEAIVASPIAALDPPASLSVEAWVLVRAPNDNLRGAIVAAHWDSVADRGGYVLAIEHGVTPYFRVMDRAGVANEVPAESAVGS